jgi:UDP-N-acetylmuramate--alanine ligase
VCEAQPGGRVLYLPKRSDVVARLPELTRPGDLVITLGAGDITSLPDEWLRSGGGFGGGAVATGERAPAEVA